MAIEYMHVLADADGKIYYSVPHYKWYYFEHSTTIPLTETLVEENEINKELCRDLRKFGNVQIIDEAEDGKYSVKGGVVVPKANWKDKRETSNEDL